MGSSDALVRIAITRVRVEKGEEALGQSIQHLDNARQAGSVLAQAALGYCYEHGIGVSRSKAEAATLYRSAAQRGSQDAFRALRRMHDEVRPAEKEFVVEE